MKIRTLSYSAAVALVAAGIVVPSPAQAAFPGSNGRIYFSSQRSGSGDLYSVAVDSTTGAAVSGSLIQVTNGSFSDGEPFANPNGSQIVYQQDDGTQFQIRLIQTTSNVTGLDPNLNPDASVLLSDGTGSDQDPSWYPDGRYVAFDRVAGVGGGQLYRYDTTTPGAPAVAIFPADTGFTDTRPVVNPANANQIAFIRGGRTSGAASLMLLDTSLPLSGTNPRNLSVGVPATNRDSKPDWHPSGNRIVFVSQDASLNAGFSKITSVDPAAPASRFIYWTGVSKNDTDPAYSPDGKDITWARPFTAVTGGLEVLDAFNVVVDPATGAPAVGAAPQDISQNNARDEMPVWAAITVTATVPQSPWTVLLPASGIGLAGLTALTSRRRKVSLVPAS